MARPAFFTCLNYAVVAYAFFMAYETSRLMHSTRVNKQTKKCIPRAWNQTNACIEVSASQPSAMLGIGVPYIQQLNVNKCMCFTDPVLNALNVDF